VPLLRCLSTLVVSVAAASIVVAPAAMAAPTPICTSLSDSSTQCQSPGNVQINDSPPVQYQPQWGFDPFFGNVLAFRHHDRR
jgi:hypothetical protein